ncbi:hypothetical protein LINGRAHAP2_LOCUS3860 [Linum grandiflorum]
MAESSSSSRHGNRRCSHQCDVVLKVAGTTKNPGRRFLRCPFWKNSSADCGFFEWVDATTDGEHPRVKL